MAATSALTAPKPSQPAPVSSPDTLGGSAIIAEGHEDEDEEQSQHLDLSFNVDSGSQGVAGGEGGGVRLGPETAHNNFVGKCFKAFDEWVK